MWLQSFHWFWCHQNLQVSGMFLHMNSIWNSHIVGHLTYKQRYLNNMFDVMCVLFSYPFIARHHSLLSRSVSKKKYFSTKRCVLLWLRCFDAPLTLLSHMFIFFYEQQKIGIKASDVKVRFKTNLVHISTFSRATMHSLSAIYLLYRGIEPMNKTLNCCWFTVVFCLFYRCKTCFRSYLV